MAEALRYWGLGQPRDLPRTDRPPKISHKTMARIIEQSVQPKCTPRELQKTIREETGTRLHITNVRKTMHRYGLTTKVPQKVYINRASMEVVRSWQYRFDRHVSCLGENDSASWTWTRRSSSTMWHLDANTGLREESGSSCRTPETIRGSWSMKPSPRMAGSSSGRASCLTRQPSSGTSRNCRGTSERWRR